MSPRRRVVVAALALLAAALTACAGLPTSGYVHSGISPDAAVNADPGVNVYIAEGPVPDATPEAIVSGFLDAAISPDQNWATAREYLTTTLAETWNGSSGITIDVSAERVISEMETADQAATYQATIASVATVDADGRYIASPGGTTPIGFGLTLEDGQWRISEAPDGIVLDAKMFPELYSSYELFYFDSTWNAMVPDLRWFGTRQNAATRIVQELVDGTPSDWLSGGVETAFGQDVTLARGTVEVDASQVAHVALTGASATATRTVSRMQQQLEASLAGANVRGVELTLDGQLSSVAAAGARDTSVDSRPLVLTDQGFGLYSGGELSDIGRLSHTIEDLSADVAVTSVAVSPDHTLAAVQLTTGDVMRITDDGARDRIASLGGDVAPSIDPFGWVWTARQDSPTSISAWDADLVASPLGSAWQDITRVSAISVSRDGARIAAIARSGEDRWVVVATIERDADGTPVAVGAPTLVTSLDLPGIALAWLDDDLTLGVLSAERNQTALTRVAVGGPAETIPAPLGAISVASGSAADSTVRVLTLNGELLMLRTNGSWQTSAPGIEVLAIQNGQPAS